MKPTDEQQSPRCPECGKYNREVVQVLFDDQKNIRDRLLWCALCGTKWWEEGYTRQVPLEYRKMRKRIKSLETALRDAINRPKGVVPDSAEGLWEGQREQG